MNINLTETYIEANGHGYSNDTITSPSLPVAFL